jgi:hypothetical protein
MKDVTNPEILVPAGRRAAGMKRMFFLLSIFIPIRIQFDPLGSTRIGN